jgi:hypothetical protein
MKIPMMALAGMLVLGASMLPASADDLTGVDRFLCAAVQATKCTESDCDVAPPWTWNIPQFIEVDLRSKTLSTTKASGEARSTPVKHLERENGLIVMQGTEAGRAFSFVIKEQTGFASMAVAREGVTVGVFGSCTPLQAGK